MLKKIKFIENLTNEMTLMEKVGQMVQYGSIKENTLNEIRAGMVGSLLNCHGAKYINSLQKIAVEETRLGIPLLIGDDVIHGFKTIFPIPLAESCSWDLDLIEKSAKYAALEAKTAGINWIFAPMVDISRDPRWGRIAEGAGEDHYLGKLVAKARVNGFQSKENNYPLTASCPKHFIGYGASIGGRDYNNCDISENYLRTYYLPPFAESYKSGALTTMCSFNDIFSIPLSVNKRLLYDILRKEIGFEGIVVSDWESIEETIVHRVSRDKKEAAYKALLASVDIDMHSGVYRDHLLEVINENEELLDNLNQAVKRILSVKYDLGLFDNPYTDEEKGKHFILCSTHREHARTMAANSIVLLKNENILPLKDNKQKIAIIGPFASDYENHLGCWSWKGSSEDVVSIKDAFKNNTQNIELLVDNGSDISNALEIAKKSDLIILALGEPKEYSGEAHNRVNLNLPGSQEKLVEEIHNLNKPTIGLIISGRPLTLTNINDKVDALLWMGHLGVEAGNAIFDILFGKTNPSAKLTASFPKHVGQIPIYYNHKSTGRPDAPKYIDCDDKPLYPFGYGLSYTEYKYQNLVIKNNIISINEPLEISIDITNTGNIAGKEIVQVYFRDNTSSTTSAVKQLCGFKKVYIIPQETKTISFTINPEEFGLYNENNEFVIEKGSFKIFVGPNSVDLLEGEFTIR